MFARAGFAGMEGDAGVLNLEVQEGLDRHLEERLTNEQLRYRLGCVAGLLDFKEVLLEREREARKGRRSRICSCRTARAEIYLALKNSSSKD